LPSDLYDREEIARIARDLLTETEQKLKKKNIRPQTLTLKIKYADFTMHSKQRTTKPGADWAKVLEELLDAFDYTAGVRLVGVSLSNFVEPSSDMYEQLVLPLGEEWV
jgi:DNA polymerase IV